jgi:xylitol oxidase
MTAGATNWAGNVAYRARRLHRPESLDELRRTVARSRRVRALGTRHSFNRLADTTGDLVDMTALPFAADVDSGRRLVRVTAGTSYARLATYLHERGLALHNLGSLPHISVAGACATATHGSGTGSGNLATAVRALELVTAAGDLVEIDEPDVVAGAVVALGALGVLSTLTLDLQPTYDVAQVVYEDLPWEALDEHLDAILGCAYSVSLFTGLRGGTVDQVWVKRRIDGDGVPDLTWTGARPATGPRHPIRGVDPVHCTAQGGVPGPWHERLPHFRAGFTPSAGHELQSEYLVPGREAASALTAVRGLAPLLSPLLRVCEIRAVAADDLWLSPGYGRDTVGIHCTWVPDEARVGAALPVLEERLAAYGARPHWGKLFTTDAEALRALYPRAADFQVLRGRFDPDNTFGNELLDAVLPMR